MGSLIKFACFAKSANFYFKRCVKLLILMTMSDDKQTFLSRKHYLYKQQPMDWWQNISTDIEFDCIKLYQAHWLWRHSLFAPGWSWLEFMVCLVTMMILTIAVNTRKCISKNKLPRKQSSWGQHGAHLGPVGPRWPHFGPMNIAISVDISFILRFCIY